MKTLPIIKKVAMKISILAMALAATLSGGSVADIEDPFRWLEDAASPRTTKWLEEQEAKSEVYFSDAPGYLLITERLQNIMGMDMVFALQQVQDVTFAFLRHKEEQQHALYSIDSHNHIHCILEFPSLSTEGYISLCDYVPQNDGCLVAYGYQKNGSDVQEWGIKNFKTGQDLPDKLTIKFGTPIWDENNQGLYYFRFIDSNSQSLYHHRLGTSVDEDRKLYTSVSSGLLCHGLQLCENQFLKFNIRKGSSPTNTVAVAELASLRDASDPAAAFKELFPSDAAKFTYAGFRNRRLYFVTDLEAPQGKIICAIYRKVKRILARGPWRT